MSSCERFLRHTLGGARGFVAVVSAGRRDGRLAGLSERFFPLPGGLREAANWAENEAARDREVFFCPAPLGKPRRITENAGPVRVIWADLDGGGELPETEPLRPTAVVATSPGRYHAFWRLSRSCPPQLAAQMNRRVAQVLGADPSGADLVQLLRLPTGRNLKYPDRPAVRLLRLEPEERDLRGVANELPPEEEGRRQHGEPVGEGPIRKGKRNEALTRIAGSLRRHGTDPETIMAVLLAVNERRCKPPLPETEVAAIARSVARYEPDSGNGFLSSAYRMGVADEKIRFRTAREISEETPSEPAWIVQGFLASGAITELDGKIKSAGKTTLVTHMLRAVLDGRSFLGRPTKKTAAVFLTEQQPASFRQALERAGLGDRDDLHVLYWHEHPDVPWPELADAATEFAREVGAGVLVVDTLGQFAGLRGDAENSAGEALRAVQPLQRAAGEGLAVLFCRHERKGGGEVGEAARGSSAFGGAVDIILSLRRPEGNTRPTVRVIESLSRFDGTPDKLVIELTDEGYRALGDTAAFAQQQAREAILDTLPALQEHAMTTAEVVDAVRGRGVGRTVAAATLTRLVEEGVVLRSGSGRRGDPYRYHRPAGESGNGRKFYSSATSTYIAEERKPAPNGHAADLAGNDACTHAPSSKGHTPWS
ncbi:hypothetical protein Rxycam_00016 [Rubrobacter xylanophilus DSM 9941]|uniref:AAA family ATPase n=1 Tax=Rubrobacter xylanophilus TaxID=49319 RepID=UPI001C640CB7|nr:AAA family ATPase [Rubrobacter xylanophilus]QYJ14220.1 hypothetical protein Rxycam_00016 [Rubrobacter xylanophilus DSM 9941]